MMGKALERKKEFFFFSEEYLEFLFGYAKIEMFIRLSASPWHPARLYFLASLQLVWLCG